jgi:nucleoside-diphosphate-sugar epimerase
MGEIVVVTGADGAVGRRVATAAATEPGVERVVAVGDLTRAVVAIEGEAEVVSAPFALDDPRLHALVKGATRLVHLGGRHGLDLDGVLGRVAAVNTIVVLSSALVYGARPDNPVPLTEAAPVRPNPSIPAAVQRGQLEGMVAAWAAEHGSTCALVRPSVVVGPENGRWLARSPWSTTGLQVAGTDAPVQFLHVDDLAAAVVALCRRRVDGPVNAAPDGWLTAEQVRALKGPTARLRVRRTLALRLARLTARFGLAPGDPTSVLAASAPWVVANDRLRTLQWEPTFTNEEAYVDADRGGPWSRLTPRHRQQLALGALGVGVVGVLGVVALLVRRRLRGRSSD